MPDLTGTPTSLGIGTYNVDVDAPSGLGFNTAMGQIDALIAARPKVTVSPLAGGPPGSPTDGDIWVATAVDANGARWNFQYDAGSGSSFKWEFVGGSPQFVAGTSATLSATIARAGDYVWQWAVDATPTAGFYQDILNPSSGAITGYAAGQNASASRGTIGGPAKVAGSSAGATFAHNISSASSIFSVTSAITPIRVS